MMPHCASAMTLGFSRGERELDARQAMYMKILEDSSQREKARAFTSGQTNPALAMSPAYLGEGARRNRAYSAALRNAVCNPERQNHRLQHDANVAMRLELFEQRQRVIGAVICA